MTEQGYERIAKLAYAATMREYLAGRPNDRLEESGYYGWENQPKSVHQEWIRTVMLVEKELAQAPTDDFKRHAQDKSDLVEEVVRLREMARGYSQQWLMETAGGQWALDAHQARLKEIG
jgi:hypothetical protein